jgi:hypothetical protein
MALAAMPAAAQVSELQVLASGTVQTNCLVTLQSGCTISATGTMTSPTLAPGTFALRVDTGSPASFNGNPTGEGQGLCFPGSFRMTVTENGGDTITFRHTGTVCEEATPGSPYQYHGAYRIDGGTGRFVTAGGGGSLAATFTRGETPTVYVYLHGTMQ